MLGDLEVRLVLAAQASSPTLRIVGGTGLSLLLGHRTSEDIDLFTALREDITPVVQAIESEAAAQGLSAVSVRSGPHFRRLEIVRGTASVRVDVAADTAPRIEAEPVVVGGLRVETLRDQRANKLVTLLGRSELRDLVDLFFLERAGLRAIDGMSDALTKDGGMDPAWFAWALGEVKLAVLPGMKVPLDLDELEGFRALLRLEVLRLSTGG